MTNSSSILSVWPEGNRAKIPLLSDRPPFDFHAGVEPEDRLWRDSLSKRIEQGEARLPGENDPSLPQGRAAIYEVTHRAYHLARVMQCFFSNPDHGNYADPFLESLLILLTWRSRIKDAHEIITDLRQEFARPIDMIKPDARDKVQEIVGRAGFSRKRPEMVLELVRQFSKRFPGGNPDAMNRWSDDEVIDFLTSISGIGKKSAICVLMYSLGRNRLPIDAHVRRVLRRTNLLRELFQEDGEMEHRLFQATAELFVPPGVRKQLHTGLVAVGKQYCRPRRPKCQNCPINNVCQLHRAETVSVAEERNLIHVDLFSGAGGGGQGFEQEGFRTILAVDRDSSSTRTYRLNHPSVPDGNVLALDLECYGLEKIKVMMERWQDRLTPREVDVMTAGIPCQGFSKAGYRTRPGIEYDVLEDPRNHLYRVVVELTEVLQPRYVVIENVPNMRSAGKGEENILRSVRAAFENIDYQVDLDSLNAEHFGVAQTRHRLILIASHAEISQARVKELEEYYTGETTLMDAIGHYPAIEADAGEWYSWVNSHVVTGHRARYNNIDDLQIFATIRPGERYVDFVERRPDIIAERRRSGRAVYSTESFPDKYLKLVPDEPGRTIVAHLQRDGNGYIHPEQTRSITPREAACIQGFDDSFVITGSPGSQLIQIGNAIPPPLARAIARLLADKIEGTVE